MNSTGPPLPLVRTLWPRCLTLSERLTLIVRVGLHQQQLSVTGLHRQRDRRVPLASDQLLHFRREGGKFNRLTLRMNFFF